LFNYDEILDEVYIYSESGGDIGYYKLRIQNYIKDDTGSNNVYVGTYKVDVYIEAEA
jgi:hypothetical protein